MKSYKTQASSDRKAKISHLGGGGMPKPDMKPSMKPDMPGMKTDGKAKGGAAKAHKSHKVPKKSVRPGPSAEALLAQPVPAQAPMAAPVSDIRPVSPAPAGLGLGAMKTGGWAHRATGGRAHHMIAGAGSGEGRLEKIGKKP